MKVYAVVVGYEPNLENLDDLIRILAEKDCHVILADNSEKRPVTQEMLQTPCTILSLHGNQGIAKAQNDAIQCALKKGAECVGFLTKTAVSTENYWMRCLQDCRGTQELLLRLCRWKRIPGRNTRQQYFARTECRGTFLPARKDRCTG